MRQLFILNGGEHEVALTRPDERYRLHLDGASMPVALTPEGEGFFWLQVGGETCEALVAVEGDTVHVHVDGATYAVRWVDPVTRYAALGGASGEDAALAPMPGTVVALHVAPGQAVASGEALLVIESMKLETTVKAWRDGFVEEVCVAMGATFERGSPLVRLAPAGT